MSNQATYSATQVTVRQSTSKAPFAIRLNPAVYRKQSIFINKKVVEPVNLETVRSFTESERCISFRGNSRHKGVLTRYEGERDQMMNYIDLYDHKKGGFISTFYQPKHMWGRVNPTNYLSLCIFHRPTRHAFCKDTLVDIDMINAHPMIIASVARQNGIEVPQLTKYVEEPKKYREAVSKHYSVSIDEAKKLFIRIIYGGKYTSWLRDNNIDESKTMLTEVESMEREFTQFREMVYANNLHILNDIQQENPEKMSAKSEDKIKNSVMSYWCQSIERVIQEEAITHLVSKYKVRLTTVIPCQDGFMLRAGDYEESMIPDIEKHIKSKLNIDMKFKQKEFEEWFDIPIADRKLAVDKTRTFDYIADEFEKTHCKIVRKSFFLEKTSTGTVAYTESKLKVSYAHMSYDEIERNSKTKIPKTVSHSFIKKWISHEHSIHQYKDVGIYPDASKCPSNEFNLWVPFACENEEPYVHMEKEKQTIINHIKIMCGNDIDIFAYFMKWIAQMIQYPETKTTCPVFISKQGAGKTTLIKLLEKMLGHSKVFETTNPGRDVFGPFNTRMKDSYLVNFNEISKQDLHSFDAQLKGLITDTAFTINQKGIDPYDIASYHRCIITTNKEDPVPHSKDCRRFLIVRSSDELIGNKDYFRELHTMLDDSNVIKTCYEYFKKIPDLENFHKLDLPRGEYQLNLQEMTTCPIEQWLEHFATKNAEKDVIELSGVEIHSEFRNFCTDQEIKFEITAQKLGLVLTNKKIDGVEKGRKTRDGKTKFFDIRKLKERFQIEYLVDRKRESWLKQEMKIREELDRKEAEKQAEKVWLQEEKKRLQAVGSFGRDIKASFETAINMKPETQIEDDEEETQNENDHYGTNLVDDEEEFEQARREFEEEEERRQEAEMIAQCEALEMEAEAKQNKKEKGLKERIL